MNNYQWLLFDADGTLFDYYQAEDAALAQNFALHNLPFQPRYQARYRKINHHFWARLEQKEVTTEELRVGRFRQLFTEIGLDFDAERFADSYLTQLSQQAPLIPGAAELLRALNNRFKLAIITNGLADVQYPRLKHSNLQSYFSTIIVSDEVGVAKPNPGIFDAAFRRMEQPEKKDVLIIGDSLTSDMAGGINYGIDTCWYNPNGQVAALPVTYEIKHLQELHQIV